MNKVKIRYQRLSDAKRFFDIITQGNFDYTSANPKTIEEEKKFLRKNKEKRDKKSEYNYSVIYNGKLVGAVGVSVHSHHPGSGEIGYFVDKNYWNLGITTRAVKLLEKICKTKFKLRRLEICMDPRNKASEQVAKKCGYKKEGHMKQVIKNKRGQWVDLLLYAKIISK